MEFPSPEINEYSATVTSPESPVLAELNRQTHVKVLYPQMLSGHIQGRILSMLSKMLQPKLILEIGTYTGYSAMCLAEGLATDGKLITIEIDPELKAMAEDYFKQAGLGEKIDMRIGNALEIIDQLGEGEELDLVFIDADKGNYVNYYNKVLPKMRKGGIILADNVLWSGRVLDESQNDKETQGLRNFNEHVANDPSVETVLLPVRDGIMVVRKL